jgi:hypothetical protein
MLEQKGCSKDRKQSKCRGNYSVHPYVLYLVCSAAMHLCSYLQQYAFLLHIIDHLSSGCLHYWYRKHCETVRCLFVVDVMKY